MVAHISLKLVRQKRCKRYFSYLFFFLSKIAMAKNQQFSSVFWSFIGSFLEAHLEPCQAPISCQSLESLLLCKDCNTATATLSNFSSPLF